MLTVCSCFWSERLIDAAKVVVLWYNSKCVCDNFTREGLIGDVLEVKLKVDRPGGKVMKVGRLVGACPAERIFSKCAGSREGLFYDFRRKPCFPTRRDCLCDRI